MRYPYRCSGCAFEFDVIKSVSIIDNVETCEKCSSVATRFIARTHFYGAKVEDAEFNPGLGCITKDRKHRARIARDRGLIEIGNEDAEKTTDTFERDRERRLDKEWDKL